MLEQFTQTRIQLTQPTITPTPSQLITNLENLIQIAITANSTQSRPSENEAVLNTLLEPEHNQELYLQQDSATQNLDFISLNSIKLDQLSAHLHILHTPNNAATTPTGRKHAREIVYKRSNFLRRYFIQSSTLNSLTLLSRSQFGPFQNSSTGLIDYKKLQALQVVMRCNLSEALEEGWGNESGQIIQLPTGFESTRSRPEEIIGRDWAGVETFNWRGTYSFLDFRVWHAFNSISNRRGVVDLENEGEAVGDCMTLQLKLLPEVVEEKEGRHEFTADYSEEDDTDDENYTGEAGSDSPSPSLSPLSPSPPATTSIQLASSSRIASAGAANIASPLPDPYSEKYPTLRFNGIVTNSALTPNLNRTISGSVEMTVEGLVHWEYVIRYGGENQWMMNGLQMGIGAKYGVLGSWTSAEHEEGSPNGPFWYMPIEKEEK